MPQLCSHRSNLSSAEPRQSLWKLLCKAAPAGSGTTHFPRMTGAANMQDSTRNRSSAVHTEQRLPMTAGLPWRVHHVRPRKRHCQQRM